MQIGSISLYSALNRGDGICKFFDDKMRICKIYNSRPSVCNVDKIYEIYFRDKMTRDEYYEINYEACKRLKENYRRK